MQINYPWQSKLAAAAAATVAVMPWLKSTLVFALVWLLLTRGAPDSWVIGIIVVPLASWCAIRLFASHSCSSAATDYPLNLLALFKFIPFFLIESLKGGCQSALLAISPKHAGASGFIHYITTLPEGRPRLFFINIVSLLPGTVSAAWREDEVVIHVLDMDCDHSSELRECENRIAALFGLCLIEPGSTAHNHQEVL
ncbi:MAG: hypothetical protein AseanaTS_07370 [Candidatus Pelagadaptatus aseana]|uniref:Na+/H+ antiporter subunit E n=1 Tax=Candidatus Pelagadaptatus aseana TaxID=3120508 RepID=UPI0039B13701